MNKNPPKNGNKNGPSQVCSHDWRQCVNLIHETYLRPRFLDDELPFGGAGDLLLERWSLEIFVSWLILFLRRFNEWLLICWADEEAESVGWLRASSTNINKSLRCVFND